MKRYLKSIIGITVFFFIVSFALFLSIDSSAPILASLLITMFAFELRPLYFFVKQKKSDSYYIP